MYLHHIFFIRMKPDHKELKKYPDAVQCNNALDQITKALQNNQWSHAKDLLDTTIQKYADQSTHLLILRSRCYYDMGEYYESIADLGS